MLIYLRYNLTEKGSDDAPSLPPSGSSLWQRFLSSLSNAGGEDSLVTDIEIAGCKEDEENEEKEEKERKERKEVRKLKGNELKIPYIFYPFNDHFF